MKDALASVMRPAPRTRSASPLARLLYAELLATRTTSDAARAFIEPLPEIAPADALTHAVRERVRARLATTPGPLPTRASPSPP